MILVQNKQSFREIDSLKIQALVTGFYAKLSLPTCDVSVIFVDKEESSALNWKYRQKPGPANVLSFHVQQLQPGTLPEPEADEVFDLGDIIICPEKVASDAAEWDVDFEANLERMIAHGLLHLLGYDHESDPDHARMTALEEKLLGRKIPE